MPPKKKAQPSTLKAMATLTTRSQAAAAVEPTTRSTRLTTTSTTPPTKCQSNNPPSSNIEDSDVKEISKPKPKTKHHRKKAQPEEEQEVSDKAVEEINEGLDAAEEEVFDDEVSTMLKLREAHLQALSFCQEDDDLEARHHAEIEEEKKTKEDASWDIFLVFSEWTKIWFKHKAGNALLHGCWCHLCK